MFTPHYLNDIRIATLTHDGCSQTKRYSMTEKYTLYMCSSCSLPLSSSPPNPPLTILLHIPPITPTFSLHLFHTLCAIYPSLAVARTSYRTLLSTLYTLVSFKTFARIEATRTLGAVSSLLSRFESASSNITNIVARWSILCWIQCGVGDSCTR